MTCNFHPHISGVTRHIYNIDPLYHTNIYPLLSYFTSYIQILWRLPSYYHPLYIRSWTPRTYIRLSMLLNPIYPDKVLTTMITSYYHPTYTRLSPHPIYTYMCDIDSPFLYLHISILFYRTHPGTYTTKTSFHTCAILVLLAPVHPFEIILDLIHPDRIIVMNLLHAPKFARCWSPPPQHTNGMFLPTPITCTFPTQSHLHTHSATNPYYPITLTKFDY